MLDLDKINNEIKTLEDTKCTTYGVCEKLAMLYIIRDHYNGNVSRDDMAAGAGISANSKVI